MPKTVLIVEDHDLNRKLFNDLLRAQGHDTMEATDGKEALALVREHRPNLVIMDIQLPGISGLEVTKMMKADEELKGIPVIAVTAFAMKGDKETMLAGGCDAYISKPISAAEFVGTVARILG